MKIPYNTVGKITYEQNTAKVSRCSQSLEIFPRPKDQDEENLQTWLKYRPHGKADKAKEIQLLKSPRLSMTLTVSMWCWFLSQHIHLSQDPDPIPSCLLGISAWAQFLKPTMSKTKIITFQIYALTFVTSESLYLWTSTS